MDEKEPQRLLGNDAVGGALLRAGRSYRPSLRARWRTLAALGLPLSLSFFNSAASAFVAASATVKVLVVSGTLAVATAGTTVVYKAVSPGPRAQKSARVVDSMAKAPVSAAIRAPAAGAADAVPAAELAVSPFEAAPHATVDSVTPAVAAPAAPRVVPAPVAPAAPRVPRAAPALRPTRLALRSGASSPSRATSRPAAAPHAIAAPAGPPVPLPLAPRPVIPMVPPVPPMPVLPAPAAVPAPSAIAPVQWPAVATPALLPATPPPVAPPVAPLADELRMLELAEAALRASTPSFAIEHLDRHGRMFPAGALRDEAAVLRIGALIDLGRRREAGDLANQFLQRRPHSVLAKRVRSMLQAIETETQEDRK